MSFIIFLVTTFTHLADCFVILGLLVGIIAVDNSSGAANVSSSVLTASAEDGTAEDSLEPEKRIEGRGGLASLLIEGGYGNKR